jgi:serine/threonine-protein kinase
MVSSKDSEEALSDTPKKTFGKYEAISHLGSGAMGVVWRAQDPVLGRTVAIKTISAALGSDNENKERFLREARAAAQLNHPNIITVFDFGQADNELYMAMELLEGKDLKELITAASLSFDQKLNIMEQVADGLAYAHGRDVVHRDLKPGNIHVQPNGQVKILDFGLARLGSSDLTKTGVVMGTPNYMSPEQVMGERADARSDVFSAGAVFYELLTNRKPFDAESVHATLYQVVHRDPPPPRQWDPRLPEPLVTIIEIAMAKQIAGRYKDARALHDAIRAFRYGEEPEVVEEYEEPPSPLASLPSPDSISADVTSISPASASGSGSSGASGSGPSLPKPQPFRSYGRTGSASTSVPPSAGVSSAPYATGRVSRPGSSPPTPAPVLVEVAPPPPPAPSVVPVAPPARNLMPMVAGGVGILVLVVALGIWAFTRKGGETAQQTTLDALADSLVSNQLDSARRALSDKDYKGALEQVEGVLKLEPNNPEAMGIREQAQSAISEIETWSGVARAAMARGADAQATQALERVMARDPKNPLVAELSSQLNASFSARATEARIEMEKARAQAEAKEGAVAEAAFAEAEELVAAATQSFNAAEFTTATQTFFQARDAYDRARRAVESPRPDAGRTSRPTAPVLPAAAAPTPPAPAASDPGPAEVPVVTAPVASAAPPPTGVAAPLAPEFETGSTAITGLTPAEFQGRFEFEILPKTVRFGTPFRVRVFLRNEGAKDTKIDRLSVRVSRNGQGSNSDARIVEDDVKVGQRIMIAAIPGEESGKSLLISPGTSTWSIELEATSKKGEHMRSTLTLTQR